MNRVITVVSGLPRSGTSLMMQMLEKGGMEILTDHVRPPDENNSRGYYEYEKVKTLQKDNSWLGDAEGKAVKIIAQLLFYLSQNYEYRIIFMERHMEEILRSQAKMLQKLGQKGAELDPSILAETFKKQVDRIKAFLSNLKHVEMITISYNEILKNPVAGAGLVDDFLGNRLSVNAMASVVNSALYRERRG
jgi:hypothetical protein